MTGNSLWALYELTTLSITEVLLVLHLISNLEIIYQLLRFPAPSRGREVLATMKIAYT
jgi:hypothetical protein